MAGTIGDLMVRVGINVDALATGLGKAETMLERTGTRMFFLGSRITAGISAPLGAAVGMISKFGLEFDQAMTESLAIMTDWDRQFRSEMEQTAKSIVDTTKFSATQAAEAYYDLASAGLSAQESIGALPTVAKFAQAGIIDLGVASEYLAGAQAALSKGTESSTEKIDQMTRIANVLTQANNMALGTVQEFAQALTNKAGNALRMVNKEVEEGVSVLAVYAQQNIRGRVAGNQLYMMLRDVQNAAIKKADAFRRMNIEVYDASGKMKNMADIIGDMERAFTGLEDKQQRQALLQLGLTQRSIAATQALIGHSAEIRNFQKNLTGLGDVIGTVAGRQMESLQNQLLQMVNKFKNVAIDIFGQFRPVIEQDVIPALQTLLKWLQNVNETLKTMPTSGKEFIALMVGLGIVIGPAVAMFGSFLLMIRAAMIPAALLKGLGGLAEAITAVKAAKLGAVVLDLEAMAPAAGAAAPKLGMLGSAAGGAALNITMAEEATTGLIGGVGIGGLLGLVATVPVFMLGMKSISDSLKNIAESERTWLVSWDSTAEAGATTWQRFSAKIIAYSADVVSALTYNYSGAGFIRGIQSGWEQFIKGAKLQIDTLLDLWYSMPWNKRDPRIEAQTARSMELAGWPKQFTMPKTIPTMDIQNSDIDSIFKGEMKKLNQKYSFTLIPDDDAAKRFEKMFSSVGEQIEKFKKKVAELQGVLDMAQKAGQMPIFLKLFGDELQKVVDEAAIFEVDVSKSMRAAAKAAEEVQAKFKFETKLKDFVTDLKNVRESGEDADTVMARFGVGAEKLVAEAEKFKGVNLPSEITDMANAWDKYNLNQKIVIKGMADSRDEVKKFFQEWDANAQKGVKAELSALEKGLGGRVDLENQIAALLNRRVSTGKKALEEQLGDNERAMQKEIATWTPLKTFFPELYDDIVFQIKKKYGLMNTAAVKAANDTKNTWVNAVRAISRELQTISRDLSRNSAGWAQSLSNVTGAMASAADAGYNFGAAVDTFNIKGKDNTRTLDNMAVGFERMAVASLQAALAVNKATGSANVAYSTMSGAITGAMSGMAIGAAIGSKTGSYYGAAIGAAAGAIYGAWKGAKQKWDEAMKEVGRDMGTAISQGLAQKIEADARNIFKGSSVEFRTLARTLNLGAIIGEAGGIDTTNYKTFTKEMGKVFDFLERGQFTVEQAGKALSDSFAYYADYIVKTRTKASNELLELMRVADEKGLSVPSMDAFKRTSELSALQKLTSALNIGKEAYTKLGEEEKKLIDLNEQLADTEDPKKRAELNVEIEKTTLAISNQKKLIEATAISSQDAADAFSGATFAIFTDLQKRGMTFTESLIAVLPLIDSLRVQLDKAGLSGGEAFDQLKRFADLAKDEVAGPALDFINTIGDSMTDLFNSGLLTEGMFRGLSGQVAKTYNTLVSQGKNADDVFAMIRPQLQNIWEIQQRWGWSVDDATQALIDYGLTSDQIGEKFKSPTEKMVTALERVTGQLSIMIGLLGGIDDTARDAASGVNDAGNSIDPWNIPVEFNYRNGIPSLPGGDQDSGDAPPEMARGGIVMRRTTVVAGEAGPEAIIPLDESNVRRPVEVYVTINAIDEEGVRKFVLSREFGDAFEVAATLNPNNVGTSIRRAAD